MPDARRAALLAALASAGPAGAMTVTYQCTGYRTMTAEFTPREAQVPFEGVHWLREDCAVRRASAAAHGSAAAME